VPTLILKHARQSGKWNDYDLLREGVVRQSHLRTPPHGYEPTRRAVMAAFAKSWWREQTP